MNSRVKRETESIIDKIIFDVGNTTKDKEIAKLAVELDQIENPGTNLDPLIDTIGKDNFFKLLNFYGGSTITFPEYETIKKNELLLASKDLMDRGEDVKWESIKNILGVSKLQGFFHLSEFFSSISFSRRITSYETHEDSTVVKKFKRMVQKIKALGMSEKEWREHFEDPVG